MPLLSQKEIEDLFITSTYNQLRKSLYLCKYYELKNYKIVFLLKKGNLSHYKEFKKEYPNIKIKLIPLSRHPNRIRTLKYIYFYFLFKNLFISTPTKKLYIFNNNGYNIFISYFYKTSSINLIEEGLINYSKNTLKSKNKIYNFISQNSIKFKNYYCTLPNYAKNYIKAENYIFFNPFSINKKIKQIELKYNINQKDAIFINQNYEVNIDYIIEILKDFKDVESIYIKFHPNNTKKYINEFINKNKNKKIKFIFEKYINSEQLIKNYKPKYAISLNSTTLLFCHLINDYTKPISITPSYLKLQPNNQEIITDFKIINQFDFILLK